MRTVPEWIGETDNTTVPDRVRVRVFEKFEGRCHWTGRKIQASDGDVIKLGDGGYGSGNCYGGDILQALAKIVGVKVESV